MPDKNNDRIILAGVVKTAVDTLLDENADNLYDPSDRYAQGYHDALLDVLDALSVPTDPATATASTDMHYYFDMDGVLAIYDPAVSPDATPWLNPAANFYPSRRPDKAAIALATCVANMRGHTADVLTRVRANPEHVDRWTREKTEWLASHAPYVLSGVGNNILVIASDGHDKSERLLTVPERERRRHCLVDDDPAILSAWVANGGTGVQYIHTNRPGGPWPGPFIRSEQDLNDMLRVLLARARKEESP